MDTDRLIGHCINCGAMPWEMCRTPDCGKQTDTKIKSDGGSTDYYKIPAGATDLIDLIEHKKMGFALGNIFKACYRLGEKDGADALYDINKIIFFAERLKNEIEKTR